MKITIKSGDIQICVEYDTQPPRPDNNWYGTKMISFTESIEKVITKSAEEVLKMQQRHTPGDDGGGNTNKP